MKWSFKIARVAGIDILLHATFLLFVAWIVLDSLFAGKGILPALTACVTLLVLFGIIVLHELGHALTARRFGIRTANITLLPIGGIASMEEIPREPSQELLVALAGPAVNILLAMLGFVLLWIIGGLEHLSRFGEILPAFIAINLVLALFNLLPAFPMDGGRVLRALLSLRIDRVRATQIAAGVGQALALLLGLVGLFGNAMLIFIAVFVWMGAEAESKAVREEALFSGITVGDIMARQFQSAHPDDTLGETAEGLVSGFQTDVPVIDHGNLIGMLGIQQLVRALATAGTGASVRDHMVAAPSGASPEDSLNDVLRDWDPARVPAIAVVQHGTVIGVLTMEAVAEHVLLKSALRSASMRDVPTSHAIGV